MNTEPAELRRHVCLHFDELKRLLGLEGDIRRVYVEVDNDYLHIHLDWRSQRPAPPGFCLCAKGGYCDITPLEPLIQKLSQG